MAKERTEKGTFAAWEPDEDLARALAESRLAGRSIRAISEEHKVPVGTLTRWLRRVDLDEILAQAAIQAKPSPVEGTGADTRGTTPALRRGTEGLELAESPDPPRPRVQTRIRAFWMDYNGHFGRFPPAPLAGDGIGRQPLGAEGRAREDDVLYRPEFVSPSGAAPPGFHPTDPAGAISNPAFSENQDAGDD